MTPPSLKFSAFATFAAVTCALSPAHAGGPRMMENLNRGVVAVRKSGTEAFVSWRILGLDSPDLRFNLYRSTNGGAPALVNSSPLRVSSYTDDKAPLSSSLTYFVKPVLGGQDQPPSIPFTLVANGKIEPTVRIPIPSVPEHRIALLWVGDLTGDGEYDFVYDRTPTGETGSQKIEACTRYGEHLWTIDLGPTSMNRDRYEPGPAAINVGHWDGLTVYDLDGDGRAEVALRAADGVTFADKKKITGLGENKQVISIIDGLTGTERARAPLPTDFLSDGPLAGHFGIAYLDGVRPSLITKLKNRVDKEGFNLMVVAWDFSATNTLTQKWKWKRGKEDAPDNHQIRIFDVDSDGNDEIADGGYVLNVDGTYRYKVGGSKTGVVHGDRFHIGDFDPNRPGLEGFAIQQDNPNGLHYLTYDAATGEPLKTFSGNVTDVARGVAADIDPASPGYEFWAFEGVHRFDTGEVVQKKQPWPNFRIWWDGDLLAETLSDGRVRKWDAKTGDQQELLTIQRGSGIAGTVTDRDANHFYGDIMGDWREEIVSTNRDYTELIICTTDIPTEAPIYTLAHNPAYRVAMTIKGYQQCHHLDYYLGTGMKSMPRPKIQYITRLLQPGLDNSKQFGVTLAKQFTGFRGPGYAVFSKEGGFLEWTHVNGAGGGTSNIIVRYSNGDAADKTADLNINGTRQTVKFPPTGGWNTWKTVSVPVAMKPAATNILRIEAAAATPSPLINCLAIP